MIVLACDPGNLKSALVVLDSADFSIQAKLLAPNYECMDFIDEWLPKVDMFVIEMICNMGAMVGATVFETAAWVGRFVQRVRDANRDYRMLGRSTIKAMLCNSSRATDANVSAACKSRFLPTGGGADPYKGTKSQPGPLYGFGKDLWAALAVGIAYSEICAEMERGAPKFGASRAKPFRLAADEILDAAE